MIHDDNDRNRQDTSIYSLNLQYSAWPTRELDQLSVRLSHPDWGIYWGLRRKWPKVSKATGSRLAL